MRLKQTVETQDEAGNSLKLAVRQPSGAAREEARIYQLSKYHNAVRKGAMIRQELDKYLRSRELWDDAKQKEYERLGRAVLEGERLLTTRKGKDGRPLKLSEGRAVALQMVRDRAGRLAMRAEAASAEANTADSLGEQSYFNYLVSSCAVYDDGEKEGRPYFTASGLEPSVEDYVERSATRAGFDCAQALSDLLYGKSSDQTGELTEWKFLTKYGFANAKFELTDKQGRLVDEHGKLIDSEGYYLDEKNQRVDFDGNPVNAEGRYVADADARFLDDDGNPVPEDGDETLAQPAGVPEPVSGGLGDGETAENV